MRSITSYLPTTTRGLLALILLVLLIPILCVQGIIYRGWYHAQVTGEQRSNIEYAGATAQLFLAYLRDLGREEHVLGLVLAEMAPFDREKANRLLVRAAADYPSLYRFSWVSPQGTVLASSSPAALGVRIADRTYFAEVRAGAREAVLSDLLVSRVDGRPLFVLARGIRDGAGRLRGMVVASANPERLGLLALAQRRVAGGAFALIDRQGRGVYRSDTPAMSWEARDWRPRFPQIARALDGAPVSGVFPWVIDDQPRVTALVPVAETGWLASASRPVRVIAAPVLVSLAKSLLLFLAIAAVAAACAWGLTGYLADPLARLCDRLHRFGEGDHDTRATADGPREVRAMAEAFNRMADQILAQQEELTAQNEELQTQQEELSAQNEELQAQQEELTAQNEELQAQQDELTAQAEVLQAQQEELQAANRELNELSEALQGADQAKNEFLAVLSHELLTPVTNMLGWAQVAQVSGSGQEVVAKALTVIERNARRQKRLVDDLLDVSRIIHGRLALTTEIVDLGELVSQQVESAQQEAKTRGIALSFTAAPAPLTVKIDPARTAQAIANLLNNALKFTGEGGAVALTCALEDHAARVEITDTGKGIPAERIEELFNPFHQLQRDETRGGLGLGLALVKGIVELQGGRVHACSPGPGQGSTFSIELPLAAGEPAEI